MDARLQEIEESLSALQEEYINEDDEINQLVIVQHFTTLLREASKLDGIDRLAKGVTITNWAKDETD